MPVQTTGSGLGGPGSTPATPQPVSPTPQPVPLDLSQLEAQAAEGQASAPVKTTGTAKKSAGQGLPSINPAQTVKSLPGQESTQTDIDNYLKQYSSELSNLGPEYAQEMAYLQPYLAPSSGLSTEQAVAKSISPDAISPNNNSPANQAINTAGSQLANAVNSQTPAIEQAFNKDAQQMGQYEKTIPYSDVLSTALAFGKYQETYGGVGIPTGGWSPEMASLYQYLSSNAGLGSTGLQSPIVAAQQAIASQALSQASAPGGSSNAVPPSNLSGGGNG